jgi:hypothetical protein
MQVSLKYKEPLQGAGNPLLGMNTYYAYVSSLDIFECFLSTILCFGRPFIHHLFFSLFVICSAV